MRYKADLHPPQSAQASCPTSYAAVVSPGISLVWNSAPGSRFSVPQSAASSASVPEPTFSFCLDSTSAARNCSFSLDATSASVYNHAAEASSWGLAAVPPQSPLAALIAAGSPIPGLASPSDASVNIPIGVPTFNATAPFSPTSLGSTVAGLYDLRRSVRGRCAEFIADANFTLTCNSPPVASAGASLRVPFTQASLWGTVALNGTLSPVTAALAQADEADRDAPTTRYDWMISFTSTAVPGLNVPGVGDAPAASDLKLSGDEATMWGVQEAFTTSKRYSGDLVSAANSLYGLTTGAPGAFSASGGGIPAADAICQFHAAAARLPFSGDFVSHICGGPGAPAQARISTPAPVYSTGAIRGGFAAAANIGGAYKVSCGTQEQSCITNLGSQSLRSAIAYDEFGRGVANTIVFNGCDLAGNVIYPGSSSLCSNWTSADSSLVTQVGAAYTATTTRYSLQSIQCSQTAALTCIRSRPRSLSELQYPVGSYRSLTPSFTPTRLGRYNVTLVATDGCTLTTSSALIETVCNAAPVPNPGVNVVARWASRAQRFGGVALGTQVCGVLYGLSAPPPFCTAPPRSGTQGQLAIAANGDTLLPQWSTFARTFMNATAAGVSVVTAPASCMSAASCIRPSTVPITAGLQWLSYDPFALAPANTSGSGLLADSISNAFAASPIYTPAYLGNTTMRVTLSDTCVMGSAFMWAAAVCNAPVSLTILGVAPTTAATTTPGLPAAVYASYGPGPAFSTATINAQVSRVGVFPRVHGAMRLLYFIRRATTLRATRSPTRGRSWRAPQLRRLRAPLLLTSQASRSEIRVKLWFTVPQSSESTPPRWF